MSRLVYRLRKSSFLVLRPASPVRHLAQANFPFLDSSTLLEEETLPWYNKIAFIPYRSVKVFTPGTKSLESLGSGLTRLFGLVGISSTFTGPSYVDCTRK
jgi:hypothetical protein